MSDPFPTTRRGWAVGVAAGRPPAERLAAWLAAAGLGGVDVRALPVRLGVAPGQVAALVATVGKAALRSGDLLAVRSAVAAEAERIAGLVDAYHRAHVLEPGISLQALRAAIGGGGAAGPVPAAVVDLVLDLAQRKHLLVVDGALARRPDWQPAVAGVVADQRERLAGRLVAARWEVPTVSELEREFPDAPVRALLANLAREGRVEQMDTDRYADPEGLQSFRTALRATLGELERGTPAQLRERLGLTRKYLIPLLEWADRRGLTRRDGDARTLVRLTDPRGAA